jgi:hypothetical protein
VLVAGGRATLADLITYEFTFDDAQAGTPANELYQPDGLGITFWPAIYDCDRDKDNYKIPGTERWRKDEFGPEILIDDPSSYERGNAPSPPNALDGVYRPIIIEFETPFDIAENGLAFVLDNDAYGFNGFDQENNPDTALFVYNADFTLIDKKPIDQTQPGFSLVVGDYERVKYFMLPLGGFYDNVYVSGEPIPEPSALLCLLTLGAALLVHRR